MIKVKNGIITEFDIPGVEFKKEIISLSHTLARPQIPLNPEWITLHNTASPGASAVNLSNYINNLNSYKSWHITIDEKTVIQQLPLNEVGWATGDGYSGPGNRTSISIEICEREGANKVAVMFIADLLKALNLSTSRVTTHQKWSGKYCPRLILPIIKQFKEEYELCYVLPKDVSYDRWSAKQIARVINLNIMSGYPDGTYNPSGYLTREETAVISKRLIETLKNKKY